MLCGIGAGGHVLNAVGAGGCALCAGGRRERAQYAGGSERRAACNTMSAVGGGCALREGKP